MDEGLRQFPDGAVVTAVVRHELRPDVGAQDSGCSFGLSLWLREGAAPEGLLFCLPGGHMTRDYFDLRVPGNDSHSFARAMAAQGFAVAAMDHPGIGDSDSGEDRYAHTPESLADAAATVCDWLRAALAAGGLIDGLVPQPTLACIGVGHSMGAMIAALAQQRHGCFAALGLLGFSTRGLPEYVPDAVKPLLADREALAAQRIELARALFAQSGEGNGRGGGDADIYGREGAEADGIRALADCRAPLLPVPAFCSMLPDNIGTEAAQIDVPVFIALGSRDMAGPPHAVPAAFPGSSDVTLCVLPETGHSHFLFPSRAGLFRRLAHWARPWAARETLIHNGAENAS